jgi:polar amino acid transport system substrate-binding protein
MYRFIVILGLLVLFAVTPCASALAQGAQSDEPTAPQPPEENLGPKPDMSWLVALRFVTEGDYPPFNYRDEDGGLTGFNVDLAKAICKELEVTCEVNAIEWGKLPDALKNDEADAVIASLAINPQTTAQFDFTNSYYATPAKFVTRTSSKLTEITPEGLNGKKIGVVAGSAHEAYLTNFFSESEIVPFPTAEEARAALKDKDGSIDLLFGDTIGLMFWVNGTDSQKCCEFRGRGFLESEYFGEGIGIAVTKGNIRLQDALNYGLARVRASGQFQELQLRYFPLAIY